MIRYRCKKHKCSRNKDGKDRILRDVKAADCASRGCPYLQSFIDKEKEVLYYRQQERGDRQ